MSANSTNNSDHMYTLINIFTKKLDWLLDLDLNSKHNYSIVLSLHIDELCLLTCNLNNQYSKIQATNYNDINDNNNYMHVIQQLLYIQSNQNLVSSYQTLKMILINYFNNEIIDNTSNITDNTSKTSINCNTRTSNNNNNIKHIQLIDDKNKINLCIIPSYSNILLYKCISDVCIETNKNINYRYRYYKLL